MIQYAHCLIAPNFLHFYDTIPPGILMQCFHDKMATERMYQYFFYQKITKCANNKGLKYFFRSRL